MEVFTIHCFHLVVSSAIFSKQNTTPHTHPHKTHVHYVNGFNGPISMGQNSHHLPPSGLHHF
jgi:hypothetical protein